MSKPVIFSLRPEPDSLEDAAFLHATGLTAFALPMMSIQPEQGGLKAAFADILARPQAELVCTSKQAARFLSKADSSLKDRRVWCVGNGTKQVLADAAFCDLVTAGGNARSLIEKITASHRNNRQRDGQHYLWLCGADIAVDIQAGLAGAPCSVTRHILYKAVPNIDKSSDFQKAIAAGQMIALCAMSERSLQLFMDWLVMHYPDFPAADIRVFVPSPALVATANKLGLNASAPPEISRLALLEHIRNWAETGQS